MSLYDYICSNYKTIIIFLVTGLGLAYVGTKRQDAIALLLPVLSDSKSTPEVVAMAALACGLISLATPNSEVVSTILQTLLDLPVAELTDGHYSKFLPLALGLCYLGKVLIYVNIFLCLLSTLAYYLLFTATSIFVVIHCTKFQIAIHESTLLIT
jgi:hypothetical protein